MGEKYEYLKKVLDDSHYTVALCGSGILAETGCRTFQNQDYAYEIEQKYGRYFRKCLLHDKTGFLF